MSKYCSFPYFNFLFPDRFFSPYLREKPLFSNVDLYKVNFKFETSINYPPKVEFIYRDENILINGNFLSAQVDLEKKVIYCNFPQKKLFWELFFYPFASLSYYYPFFLLHASSGVKKGRGYLFVGESGAGKSTALSTFGLKKINEDRSVVGVKGNLILNPFEQYVIYPEMVQVPLKAIFFLKGKDKNQLLRIDNKEEVLYLLFSNFLFFSRQLKYKGKMMEWLNNFVFSREIEYYYLSYLKSESKEWFWNEIQN